MFLNSQRSETLEEQSLNAQAAAGRDFQGRRWGPRPLDLDIIFYGAEQVQSEALQIPHARWQEREFVKAPLSDLYTEEELQELSSPLARHLHLAQSLWLHAGGRQTSTLDIALHSARDT